MTAQEPPPPLFAAQAASVEDAKRLSDQAKSILARLREGPADEIDLHGASGSRRVAARIYELREAGHEILSWRSVRKCGGYTLVKEAKPCGD